MMKRLFTLALIALGSRASAGQCNADIRRLTAAHRWPEARRMAEALAKKTPADAAAMHCMGRLELDQDDPEAAIDWFEKAVAADPKSAIHHAWLGLALRAEAQQASMLRMSGLMTRMKTEMEQALVLDSSLVEARFVLLQYHVQVPASFGGSMAKAREHAAALIKSNPARGHLGLGLIAEQEKDLAAAEREMLAAITALPDSDVAYSAAGNFYRRHERWPDAATVYDKALRRLPPDASPVRISNAHYYLGLASEKTANVARARSEYRAAVAANPRNANARKALDALPKPPT